MSAIDELRRRQRRSLLSTVDNTDRLVKQVYVRAADQLATKARGAKDGTLTKRWLNDYTNSVQETVDEMDRTIDAAVTRGVKKAASIATEGTADYIGRVFGIIGADVPGSFKSTLAHVNTDAVDALIRGKLYAHGGPLSKRIWDETGRLQGGIEEILAQGLAQQQSTYQIARALEAYVNPKALQPSEWRALYPGTPFPMNVDYNATRLARTAINQAHWYAGIKSADANPLCMAMHWELSNSHFTRQVKNYGRDICDDHAEHDDGLGRGNFPVKEFPMPHPQCLCDRWEVLPEPDDAAARIRSWIAGAPDARMDKAFASWKP